MSEILTTDEFMAMLVDSEWEERERHQLTSTIICSQLPVGDWHSIIGDGTVADAILDRIVHSSHRIELQGESLCKQKSLNQ